MLNYLEILKWYEASYDKEVVGLQITVEDIKPFIFNKTKLITNEVGKSDENESIFSLKIGSGSKKVLIWSQMHGNESTGTKAILDLISFFESIHFELIKDQLFKELTIQFIPILNPDGARAYTRENADGIDLNRDAVDLKAKESQLLNTILYDFKPDFCFNLHDQRTIFNVEGTQNPATISFLAPSVDKKRTLTESRKKTMSVIVSMNQLLQQIIPNQVGRYTDEFYPNATGDNFQKAGFHTILVEAGHFKDDYDREEVRKFNFLALLQGLYFIATTQNFDNYLPYFDIPNNDKQFFDVIYKNTFYENKIQDVAFQYKYKLINNKLEKSLELEKVGDLSSYFGHFEKNFNGNSFSLV
ncbi:MAG: M14 family zinc carboxypeptidase [Flavobacteriaceae bacterium]|nr:M14 family zinc carboxypeptidase [Flavobacteriaceae bacterium]